MGVVNEAGGVVRCMVTEGEPTLGGGRVVQCIDDVLWSCTLETYIVLLTGVTPINLIFKQKNDP